MKSSARKGLQIDVGKNKSLVLLLCSAFTGVLEAAFRNSRQTVKTRVLGSSLSPSRPSAAILVSERWDRSTLLDLNVHNYADFFLTG